MAGPYYSRSDKVSVFPSARRANGNDYYNSARELSEENLTRQLFEKSSFIVKVDQSGDYPSVHFIIKGYQFSVQLNELKYIYTQNGLSNSSPLWAYITLEVIGDLDELSGQDGDDSEYKGLKFITPEPTTQPYRIQLCDGIDSNNQLIFHIESFYKLSTKSIENIDGGTI